MKYNKCLHKRGERKIYGTLRREFIVCLIYLPLWTPHQKQAAHFPMWRWRYQQNFKVDRGEGEHLCSRKTLECDCNINFGLYSFNIPHAILCNHFSILSLSLSLNNHLETAYCGFYAFARLKISTSYTHTARANGKQYFHFNFWDTNNRIIFFFENGTCVTNLCVHEVPANRDRSEWFIETHESY